MAPGEEWWLDAEASRAAALPADGGGAVMPEGAITFTLRPGSPIYLTREQVCLPNEQHGSRPRIAPCAVTRHISGIPAAVMPLVVIAASMSLEPLVKAPVQR